MNALLRSADRIRCQLLQKSRTFGNLNHPIQTIHTNYHNFHSKIPSLTPQLISSKFLCSQSDSTDKNKYESVLEDGFSDLDKSPDELSPINQEPDVNSRSKRGFEKERLDSPLFKLLLETSSYSMNDSLENWVKQGNEMETGVVFVALFHLRKLKLFNKALQFMEWLEKSDKYEFTDRDYTTLLDLIAKVQCPIKAEKFLTKIPQNMRNEVTYRTLLANYVSQTNTFKSEQIFNKMRDLGFPLTTFACNQLLLLYKRVDKKKISDVLLMMEKEDLKPSLFTYRILIDIKGKLCDIIGLEQLLDTMKLEGIEPDLIIKSQVVKYYISGGFNEKAKNLLREIEGGNLRENRPACKYLMPLYADLGLIDEINRVWKVCELNPLKDEVIGVIKSWGKIGEIENAEKVFNEICERFENVSWYYYDSLMNVYANKKLVDKVENFDKLINEKGAKFGGVTLDSIVKMYIELGEINKTELILQNWVKSNSKNKPMYNTYLNILEEFGKKGDIHNAERIFHCMNIMGYWGRLKRYEFLLKAYVNAKKPVYGFRERMKGDNLFPNRLINELLVKTKPFEENKKFDSMGEFTNGINILKTILSEPDPLTVREVLDLVD